MKIYSFTQELTRRDKKYINYYCDKIINDIETQYLEIQKILKKNKNLKSPDVSCLFRERKIAKLKGALC